MQQKLEMEEEKHDAQAMAEMIERWLGNPLARNILKFCTARDKCGRRIDIALRKYLGEDMNVCHKCKLASHIVKKILDTAVAKAGFTQEDVKVRLQDFMFRKGMGAVLEGIAEYGPMKPFTSYSPFLIVWNYTKACNLSCVHCYEDARKPAKDELTTKEVLKLIDKMGKMGVAYVALSGGEPLLRKDFFKAAKRMKENEIAFSVATNGTLLTKENVRKLKENDCRYIQISLDGASPETHNRFRGKNSFEKTIEGIKNSVASGITVGIATCITHHNYKEVPKIIDLADKLGVKIWMNYNFVPTGRGKEIINTDLTPEQREEMLTMLSKETRNRRINLLSTAPQYGRASIQCEGSFSSLTHFDTFSQREGGEKIKFLADFIGGCGAGRLYCALEPNGDITPCVFIPIKLGNVRKNDLGEVWRNHPILLKIRDRKSFWGHCRECEFRNVCGGCRARAYGYFGDIQGPDPGCINNKEYWNKLKIGESKKTSLR
jgi:radical SAM protein with 4Fe4S-binding SPASM domain